MRRPPPGSRGDGGLALGPEEEAQPGDAGALERALPRAAGEGLAMEEERSGATGAELPGRRRREQDAAARN